jgi:hypothetical protein
VGTGRDGFAPRNRVASTGRRRPLLCPLDRSPTNPISRKAPARQAPTGSTFSTGGAPGPRHPPGGLSARFAAYRNDRLASCWRSLDLAPPFAEAVDEAASPFGTGWGSGAQIASGRFPGLRRGSVPSAR